VPSHEDGGVAENISDLLTEALRLVRLASSRANGLAKVNYDPDLLFPD